MDRFLYFCRKISKNSTKTCWVLKCDIRKFFASVDHKRLLEIIARHDVDEETQTLFARIIESFDSGVTGKGLPLGNLTSQLLVNVYMNEFDQYMKHVLKIKYYIRFADDFVIMNGDREVLKDILKTITIFLHQRLFLSLHPDKVSIRTFASGIDFLGWVHFPDHRVLRTTTKKRMFKNLRMKEVKFEIVQSYVGLLQHGNTHKLQNEVNKFKT